MQKHIDRVAREYERDWPLVASERNGKVNGHAASPRRMPARRRHAERS
jgi:hypothetical protein